MARKISTYQVASGCIQEGSRVYLKGDPYTPPTEALEQELVEAGIIVLFPGVTIKSGTKAKPAPQTKAEKAQVQSEGDGSGDVSAEEQGGATGDCETGADDLLGAGD